MTGQTAAIVFGGGAVVVVGSIVAYYIARYLRGSIKLTLPQNSFAAGEAIAGSFDVVTRKEIQGNRLYAALIGMEVTEERRGEKTQTHSREIHRHEETLEKTLTWPAGQTKHYTFTLPSPAVAAPEILNSTLAKAARIGLELLGADRRRIKWSVQIRLDAKGIDLVTSQRVHINSD
ncbi:MAG: hypothetical protein NTY53_09530 [Kiritimatiellaeota bacterium]|nr:hypothetical protein [Kiritimatiellota bacterium]